LTISGYPIFVSPLITSYSSTSKPLNDIVGGELAWDLIRQKIGAFFQRFYFHKRRSFFFSLPFIHRAYTFFLSHCVGNASGTNEAIQLAERRTLSPAAPSLLNVPVTSAPVDPTRSSSVQQTLNSNNNEINMKKSIQLEQQTSVLAKRTSDSFMTTTTTTTNDEQNRRRSSLSTELNVSDRSSRKAFNTINSNTSTTVNSNKDLCTNSSMQINKSIVTNSTSNEKVVIIDTTAVSFVTLNYRIDIRLFSRSMIRLIWVVESMLFGRMNKCD
jgi:hypothetical protein